MKLYTFIVFFLITLFLRCNSFAQSLSPNVIGSQGGYTSTSSGSVAWSVGEPVITTMGSATLGFGTQGFEQPVPCPTAKITTSTPTTFCQGNSVVLSANTGIGLTYQWSKAGNAISGATSSTYTATTTGSYTVKVTNGLECSVTSSAASVTVIPLPAATITSTSTAICQGSSVLLNANTGAGLTYQWKNGGTAISGATNSTYAATTAGTYTVTVTNSNNCSTTSAGTVLTINPSPTATISATSTSFCQGSGLVMNANTGSGYTYQWSNSGTAISGATNSTYTATTGGTYTVTVTNSSNCSVTSSGATITENAIPAASITATGSTTVCSGSNVVLNANTGAGLTYQWANSGSAISGATNSSYTASSTGTYNVTVTNGNNCSATATGVTVTVNTSPAATITPISSTNFCQGGSVVLSANTGAGITYQWNKSGTTINGATNSSYTATTSGNYTVKVTDGGNSCSTTSAITNVTVNTLPTAAITPASSTTFCDGGSVKLNANTGAGLTYQWNNGASILGATNASYDATTSGTYTVTVTNGNNCSTTSLGITVTVNSLPTATVTLGSTSSFCSGGGVTLNANTGSGLSYQWSNLGTTIGGATNASYTVSASGTYTVTVTNTNNCSATSAPTSVTANSSPTATISATGSTTFCTGGSVVLNTNVGTGLTYQWSNSGVPISGATNSSYTANTSGVYKVTITDATNNCNATSNGVTVTVNTLPVASITPASSTTFCQGGNVVLNANTGTGYTYQWNNAGTAISGATNSSYTANASGSYTVAISTGGNCTDTSTATSVTVNSLPTATIDTASTTTFCQGGSVVLNANTGAGLTYQWANSGSSIGGATNSSYSASVAGSYTVTVTDANNCSANSTGIQVTVNASATVSITANGPTTFCTGGNVTLNATGAGVTYQWMDGGTAISGATTTSYTVSTQGTYVIVATDANACQSSDSVSITVNSATLPIAPILAVDTVLCKGGRIRLIGEPGLDSYQWIRNDTILANATSSTYYASIPGIYTLVGTQGSACAAEVSISIIPDNINSAPKTPVIKITPNGVVCNGTIYLSTTTGLSGYQWGYNGYILVGAVSDSLTPYYAGTYTVDVDTVTGCSNASDAITVSLDNTIITPIIAESSGTLQTTNITATNVHYQWYADGRMIVNDTSATMPLIYNGKYNVEVTYPGGCKTYSTPYLKTGLPYDILRAASAVTDSTILLSSLTNADFAVYPNPSEGIFTITYTTQSNNSIYIKLYNMQSILLDSWSYENVYGRLSETINIQELPSGMYILVLFDGVNSYNKKIVIK